MNYSKVNHPHWKFKLDAPYAYDLHFQVFDSIGSRWVSLLPRHLMLLASEYFWDGITGFPRWFQPRCMLRGSLIHDAGLQLIKEGLLSPTYRERFDEEFRLTCLEDGTPTWVANLAYNAVRLYAQIP